MKNDFDLRYSNESNEFITQKENNFYELKRENITQFNSLMNRYEGMLNKMEIVISKQADKHGNITMYERLQNSTIGKLLVGKNYKIALGIYIGLVILSMFLNPIVTIVMVSPLMFIVSGLVIVKVMRALHETFSLIFYTIIGFIGLGAILLIIFWSVTIVFNFQNVYF